MAALGYATRTEAIVVGKPSPTFFEMALRDMGVTADDALMVGDDIDSDIGGGHAAGLATVLEVKTGKFTETDGTVAIQPTHRIDSIADLPGLITL